MAISQNAATAALVILLVAPSLATDAAERSRSARSEFQRTNPCPVNDKHRGPCPGYVVDHITPLCAGGHDHPANMQWQTIDDAKIKDSAERRQCRALKLQTPISEPVRLPSEK